MLQSSSLSHITLTPFFLLQVNKVRPHQGCPSFTLTIVRGLFELNASRDKWLQAPNAGFGLI